MPETPPAPTADGLTLVIGNRNGNVASLPPWLLLKHLGLPFHEVRIATERPGAAAEIRRWSPTGRLPVLRHGPLCVWEGAAILEYASELAGGAGWPAERESRAVVRANAAELLGQFQALRNALPVDPRLRDRVPLPQAVQADLERLDLLWSECRRRNPDPAGWLAGRYGIADAASAPLVLRIKACGTGPLGPVALSYVTRALADPFLLAWSAAAAAEPAMASPVEAGQPG